jgi:glycosyltransferase involved in cell wall biosynthesis
MAQRPRVLLLIPHLGGGGAEQVTALLARSLNGDRYDLHLGLMTRADIGSHCFPPHVRVYGLGAGRVRTAAWKLLWLVRRLKPDVVLSGMAHLNFLVLLLRPFLPRRTHVVVRQNSTVSAALGFGDLPGYTRLLYRWLYHRADRVICQTGAMADDLARQLGTAEEQLAVLANPLDVQAIRDQAKADPGLWTGAGPHLLAIGRLAPVKGFDMLLQALAAARAQFPDADLLIAGAGPAEAPLRALCRELGLEAAVSFAGHVDRPSVYFPGAAAFVLSSRHEGLPNALLEAAAGGLPIVALPSSQGVVDLLQGQPGVWLAPVISTDALAETLVTALQALRPGARFAHTFVEQFRIERSIQAYEDLIDSTLRMWRR